MFEICKRLFGSRITNYGYTRYLSLIPAFTLSLSLGYLHGRLLAINPAQLHLEPNTTPLVATIELYGIRNGNLLGTIHGEGRLILGKTPVIGSGTFSIPAGALLTQIIEIDVPTGAMFVASKKGKKYYPIRSASAGSLIPENRVYFSTAAEAEAAGYHR